jgi:hypothetical protein
MLLYHLNFVYKINSKNMNNKNVYNQIMERLSIIVKKNVEKNNMLNEGQFSWFTQDTGE